MKARADEVLIDRLPKRHRRRPRGGGGLEIMSRVEIMYGTASEIAGSATWAEATFGFI